MRRVAIAGFLALLGGCASIEPLPDPAHQPSAIAYAKTLERSSQTALVRAAGDIKKAGNLLSIPLEPKHAGYAEWSDTMCADTPEVHSRRAVEGKFGEYCTRIGGSLRTDASSASARYCLNSTEDAVLFYVDLTSSPCGYTSEIVRLHVVEPSVSGLHNMEYESFLREHGFAYPRERRAQQEGAIMRAQMEAQAEQARAVRDAPRLRIRGTKICRKDQVWQLIGFVEDVEATKIQIRIANMHSPSDPNVHPGGWMPGEIIWDYPDRWRVCE